MTCRMKRPNQLWWALSNMGNVWGIFWTRKDAIDFMEKETSEDWKDRRSCFELRRVVLVETSFAKWRACQRANSKAGGVNK